MRYDTPKWHFWRAVRRRLAEVLGVSLVEAQKAMTKPGAMKILADCFFENKIDKAVEKVAALADR
jgi:hypothetical protein